jgi:NTE family protein
MEAQMRGIALEGGGAKGSYHVGALKALKELGIDFQVITGTSIGAVNGAIIASGNLELLEQLWLSISVTDMIKVDEKLFNSIINFDLKFDQGKLKAFVTETFKQGGLDVSPFKTKLKELVDEDVLRQSPIDFGLVSLSMSDFKPVELFLEAIPKGKLHDYIFASSNLPVFRDEKFDDKKMLDGAFVDNLPIKMLLDRGCDEVIAIRLNAPGRIRRIKNKDQMKVTYIVPSEDLGKVLEIDPERAKYNIKMGYFDTLKVMTGLHGSKYYITNLIDDTVILNRLIEISEASLQSVARILGVGKSTHRVIFEDFLPLLGDMLKVDKTSSYSELILKYFEFMALEAGIDRFEIMDYSTFVRKVNRHYFSQIERYKGIQDDVVNRIITALPNKSALLLPHKLKKELLTHMYFTLMQGLEDTGNPN